MPRTLDPVAHAVRRDAFLDVAQRLIQVKGYEQMSIQDVLDELDASRGAFYHYFDSKGTLLEAVIGRMVEDVTGALGPLLADPDLAAAEKFRRMFANIASWKSERRELMLEVVRTWTSDDNAIVREKYRHRVVATITPIFAAIIRQGVTEGSFEVTSPDHTARVLISLLLGAQEHATDLYLARQAGRAPFELVEGALLAYPDAFERILGAPAGSLRWYDRAMLEEWFG
ncbi:MAG TPA: TetR/AcrR family transcriptional regulator [Candidatus Dormibacteraeota bacterium]|nr:TetR/AcrR family transcriptional regulator [Candidatus Dormibacteraeota bacterium]